MSSALSEEVHATMKKPAFSQTWNTVVSLAGKTFVTKTGLPFIYQVKGQLVYPSRTNYQIARSDFQVAYKFVPLPGPGAVNRIIRGPAYVWAILHDKRVSHGGIW